jgi:hypothetical protein
MAGGAGLRLYVFLLDERMHELRLFWANLAYVEAEEGR